MPTASAAEPPPGHASARPEGGAGDAAAEPEREAERLRAEHDALAERLAARRSVDLVRRGAYSAFAAFIASGLSVKLAFDRWFSTRALRFKGPPMFFFMALVVALALGAVGALAFVRARRIMRAEDADFARFRDLRARLHLDP
jgi:hypothetical protein